MPSFPGKHLSLLAGFVVGLTLASCGGSESYGTLLNPGQRSAPLSVTPSTFRLLEGDSVALTVASGGLPVGPGRVAWLVQPSMAGRVGPTGVFVALNQTKDVRVTATVDASKATVVGSVAAVPAAVQWVAPTSHSGPSGRLLPDSLTVRVVSAEGKPVEGILVSFDVVSGEGALSNASSYSNGEGIARSAWTLGPNPGLQSVRASSEGLGEVIYSVEAVPDFATATAAAVEGDEQEAIVGDLLPIPLTLQVRDSVGNPLEGMEVHWSFSSGYGFEVSASAAEETAAMTLVTDREGRSSVRWRVGTVSGFQKATAYVSMTSGAGSTGSPSEAETLPAVSFGAVVAPASVTSLDLTPTSATLSPGGSRAFSVSPQDQYGNVVPDASVTWISSAPAVASVNGNGVVTGQQGGTAIVTASSGGVAETASITVDDDPAGLTIASGDGQTGTAGRDLPQSLRVRVTGSSGDGIAGESVRWSVSGGGGSVSPATGATDAQGYAQAVLTLGRSAGTNQVRASVTGLGTVFFTATGVPGPVDAIVVAPSSATLEVGESQRFVATARDAFGNPVPDVAFTWSTSRPSVASVDGTGRATALSDGLAAIRARTAGVTGSADLTVSSEAPPPPASDPGDVTDLRVAGATESTITVRWTEVDDGTGSPAKYALRIGSPTIDWGAAWNTQVPLSGTTIGATREYTWTGLQSGQTYQVMAVAYRGSLYVDAVLGPLSNIATGTTATTQLTVSSGDDQSGTVGASLSQPLRVRLTNGGTGVSGRTVTWTVTSGGGSIHPSTSTTDGQGYAQATWTLGTTPGEEAARASVSGVGSVDFSATAGAGAVATVLVSPASATVQVGSAQQFSATARDQFGNTLNGTSFTWSSTATAVATVGGGGLARGVSTGTAYIKARTSGVADSSALTVAGATPPPDPARVTTLQVTGTTASSVTVRWTQVDDGTGHPADYALRYGSPTISWQAASATQTTVGGTFIGGTRQYTFTGMQAQTGYQLQLVSYRGTWGADAVLGSLSNIVSATTTSTSSSQSPTVTLTPPSVSLSEISATAQLTAVARDGSGAVVSNPGFTWQSRNTSVVTVSSSGVVTARGAGTTRVVASTGCCGADSASVTVTLAAVPTTIQLSRTSLALDVGSTSTVSATILDQFGQAMAGETVAWSSADPAVATVNSSGRVTAVSAGSTTITARDGSASETLSVTVNLIEVPATIQLSPASVIFNVGSTTTVSATVLDQLGHTMPGETVTWSSSNTAVATVNSSGRVTAVSAGSTTITARDGSVSKTLSVTVNPLPPPPSDGGGGHEPSGYGLISQQPFNTLQPSGWTVAHGGYGLADDASSPCSPSSVGRMTFGSGFTGGSAPGHLGYDDKFSVDEIYLHFCFKVSSNWDGHSSGVNKIIFVNAGGSDIVYFSAQGVGSAGLHFQVRTQRTPADAQNYSGNAGGSDEIVRGRWYDIEVRLKLNNPGSANGEIDVWMDGVKTHQYSNANFIGSSAHWQRVAWEPTYGGGSVDSVGSTQYQYMDDLYISGR